jgi:Holliday junction DNA helicase RuvA
VISSITGTISAVKPDSAIVTISGFGLKVFMPASTLQKIRVSESHTFHTSLQVREDSLTLFGFLNDGELSLFEQLLGVSGVGPKSALSVVSKLSPAEIVSAVQSEDDSVFKKVNGIGPKTAKLIVVALGGRVNSLGFDNHSDRSADILNAVTALGFSSTQVYEALNRLNLSDLSASEAIRLVLSSLAKK